jgi:hypothetical protein
MNVDHVLQSDPVRCFLAHADRLRLLEPIHQRHGLFLLTTPVPPALLAWAHARCDESGVRTVQYTAGVGDSAVVVDLALSRTARAVLGDSDGPVSALVGSDSVGGLGVALGQLHDALRDLDDAVEATALDLYVAGVCADATLDAASRPAGAGALDDLVRRAGFAV